MYQQYFGLGEAPFAIAVNPRYLYMSASHRDALAHLLYGVAAGGGFVLLTGEVGTGKSTINRCFLAQLPETTDVAVILNPAMDALQLLATVCDELGIDRSGAGESLKDLTDLLHRFLLRNHEQGRHTVLLIDEAQHLDFETLEQIRLLTNLETPDRKLLQIVLIGQPELAAMVQRPELRQLNQRITARFHLQPLSLAQTREYIAHRLQVAGLSPGVRLFPDSVVRRIYRWSRGVPRLINVLCDRILLGMYGRGKTVADRALVRAAIAEVSGGREGSGTAPRTAWYALAAVTAIVAGVALAWYHGVPGLQQAAPAALAQGGAAGRDSTAAVDSAMAEDSAAAGQQRAVPVHPQTQDAGRAAPPAVRLLPRDDARAVLWRLFGGAGETPAKCAAQDAAGLRCETESVGTWDALAGYDRPLLLQAVDAGRFAAAMVYLGLRDDRALLWQDGRVVEVAAADIGRHWNGDIEYLWRPPREFTEPFGRGAQGPVVATVAEAFAVLDGRAETLLGADNRFNALLEQRVRLFQRQHGLAEDGIVGRRTLLKLNEQLGRVPTLDTAPARLAAMAPPEPQRGG